MRKNFLVSTCLVVTRSPQDIMGSFPFTDIKREMKRSASGAASDGPGWRQD